VEWTGNTGIPATERNVSAAMSVRAEARKSVRAGRPDDLAIEPQKFDAADDEFLEWVRGEQKGSTAHRIVTSFGSLKKYFTKSPVHSITPINIEKFKTWRRQAGIQDISIRHDLHNFSKFFQYAIKANWCKENPVERVDIPSGAEATRDYVVSPEEEKSYFAVAKGPLHDLARIILDQRMRPEEIVKLRAENVDLAKGTLRVVQGKSPAARRTLILSPAVAKILKRRIASTRTKDEGWIFPGKKKGTHIVKLNNAHDKTGVPWTIYEFRHTFATRFGQTVGDPFALARILGHADLRTVMKYCHTQDAHTAEAMRKYHGGPKAKG
jgi:integrase